MPQTKTSRVFSRLGYADVPQIAPVAPRPSESVSEQAQAAREILGHLSDIDIPHALIGGLAVSARTEPRFTQDLDLVVAVDNDASAEKVVFELTKRGYSTVALIEHEARDRLGTARLEQVQPPVEGQVIDLLFASSGIEPEIAASAERIQVFRGVTVPVARTGHLIALKVLARDDEHRPQDLFDLRVLIDVADEHEIELARKAVALITERGFNRERDLKAGLELLLAG